MTENFAIRVKKGNAEVEVTGERAFVIEQIDRLIKLLGISADVDDEDRKRISLGELLSEKTHLKHTETVTLFAYYIERILQEPFFNVNDIDELFLKSKTKGPANTNDTVNSLVRKGHLMEVDEKKDNLKCWTITMSGIKFVESKMGVE
ncbi:MAG: hypothetical protein HXS54_14590 [Theionarchaea archaeon]|nr:hypothetical protein [Theionarchaea archaeon]